MKIIKTKKYVESAYEGQAYTPEMEDSFVDNVVDDIKRKKRTNFYPKGVPSAFKAKYPSPVADKDTYRALGDLGRERGYVESPYSLQDVRRKRERIQKAIERDNRLDQDRSYTYRNMNADQIEKIIEDVERYEEANPGVKVTDRMLDFIINRNKGERVFPKRNTIPFEGKPRDLVQLNRVSYTIDDAALIELSEKGETEKIIEFLLFLENKINEFANDKELDADSLKDYLLGSYK